jgi:hypothetical protein
VTAVTNSASNSFSTDRREAVRRRVHDLDLRDRLVERVRLLAGDPGDPGRLGEARDPADLLRDLVAHPAEVGGQELPELLRRGALQHPHEDAQLDTVRVGLDLARRLGEHLGAALEDLLLVVGAHVDEARVRVGDRALPEELVHGVRPALVPGLEGDRHHRPVVCVPVHDFVADDLRVVLLRVDQDLEAVGGLPDAGSGDDPDRLAGREHPVHPGGADADALLPAALPEAVEFRAVEKLPEDLRDLRLHHARTVVLDRDREPLRLVRVAAAVPVAVPVAVRALGREDLDPDVREDSGLLAGVEAVVDGFLHGREQRLRRIVESEQVAVLREELRNGDLALLRAHLLGGQAAASLPAAGALPALLRLRRRFALGLKLGREQVQLIHAILLAMPHITG